MAAVENSSALNSSDASPRVHAVGWLPFATMVLVAFSIGYFYCGPYTPVVSQQSSGTARHQQLSAIPAAAKLVVPEKSLSPEQVVAAQMNAMDSYRNDRSAIRHVFAFASPANRSMTGPLERFEQMLLASPYNLLLEADHWIAGKIVSREGLATQVVSAVDREGRVSMFRFYLSLQTEDDDYLDCWMTDRVLCLFQGEFRDDGKFATSPIPTLPNPTADILDAI